jgi:hypothetical protein
MSSSSIDGKNSGAVRLFIFMRPVLFTAAKLLTGITPLTHPHRRVRPHHQTLRPHLGHYFPGRNRTEHDLTEITARSRSCVSAMKYDNAPIYVKTLNT